MNSAQIIFRRGGGARRNAVEGLSLKRRIRILVAAGAASALAITGTVVVPQGTGVVPAAVAQENNDQAAGAKTPTTGGSSIATAIEVDAIANGYVASSTDTTNAAKTISGHVYKAGVGGLDVTNGGPDKAVPEGTEVFVQWIDVDGAVSPIYKTVTHDNPFGGLGGGLSTFSFDLREPWIDANGKERTFYSGGGQRFRLFTSPDLVNPETGNKLKPFRQAPGFLPRFTYGSEQPLGDFNLDGILHSKTGVFVVDELDVEPMKAKTVTEDTKGPIPNPGATIVEQTGDNWVSGRVWYESGWALGEKAPVRETSITEGPAFGGHDRAAKGVKVFLSKLTPEAARRYANEVRQRPVAEQPVASLEFLKANPGAVAETVFARTDANGYYTIRSRSEDQSNMFMWVEDEEGNVLSTYSPYMRPIFGVFTGDDRGQGRWVPQSIPSDRPIGNRIVNQHFAIVQGVNPTLDITNFDMSNGWTTGDAAAELTVTGPLQYGFDHWIEWTNSEGKVVKVCDIAVAPDASGCTLDPNEAAKILKPKDPNNPDAEDPTVEDGEVFTAFLVAGDKSKQPKVGTRQNAAADPRFVYASDSFAVDIVPKVNEDAVTVVEGQEADPFETAQDVPEGGSVEVSGLPAGLTVDPATGKVSGVPDKLTDWKSDEESRDVTVTVTVKDKNGKTVAGPTEKPVKVLRDTDKDGVPDVADDDDDGDGVSDAVEKEKGSDPKDEGSIPATVIDPVEGVEITNGDQTVVEGTPIKGVTVTPADKDATVTVDKERLPKGVEFDPETNTISGTPVVDDWGEDEEERSFEIPVTVENKDGSKKAEKVTVTVQRDTDKDGVPDVADDDDDGDGVSDAVEKEKGSDPKDPDSKPSDDASTPSVVDEQVTVTEHEEIDPFETAKDVPEKGSVEVEGLPDGLTADDKGQVTGTPTVDEWGDAEERDFPVKVTVKDEDGKTVAGPTEKPVKVLRDTDKDGVPDVTDEDDDGDGVSDAVEKEKGSDPKDPDSKPSDDTPAPTPDPEPEPGSSEPADMGRCVATGVGIGLPLLLLAPLGLAAQLNLPGVSQWQAQIESQIREMNIRLQQEAGIFNPQLARMTDEFNAVMARPEVRTAVGGIGLLLAGLAIGGIMIDACKPAGGGSSTGSSGLEPLVSSGGNEFGGSSQPDVESEDADVDAPEDAAPEEEVTDPEA